jgi:hypothetical protein
VSTFDPDSDPSSPDYGAGSGGWRGAPGPGGGLTGPYGRIPNLPGMRRLRRPRGRFGCLALLVLFVIVLAVIYIVPNPWALHIGGRFTPTESWQGYGSVSASNGGRYLLYLNLRGGLLNGGEDGRASCSGRGCDSLGGTAKLCTTSGKSYTFEIGGAVHSWWATDGAATSVDLTDSPPLPDGWVVALHGAWHGPALELSSPDNSWTEVFTPAGAIRSVTSTADAGTATTTIAYGDQAAFQVACQRLAA